MKENKNFAWKNIMKKSISSLIFLIASILILSCSTTHTLHEKIIYKDDDFNNEKLHNSRFVIWGISSNLDIGDQERINYSVLLSDILYHKKLQTSHSIDIVHTNQLMYRIGETDLINMMKKFDQDKIFDQKTMQFVRDTIPDAKYLLIAFIKNENIVDDTPYEEYVKDDGEKEKLQTTYKKTYILTVEFQIYDTFLGKLVLNSSITNETKRTEKVVEEPVDSVGDLVLDILLGDSTDTEPAKIDRKKVLVKTFEKFADQLLD